MPAYLALLLGSLIAGSRYALTIGRPIVQSSTWHFTYAEALQFPYPVTVTLLQLIVTYALLLCVDFLTPFLERVIAFQSPHHAVELGRSSSTKSSPTYNGTQSNTVVRRGWIFGLGWATLLEVSALAVTVAADAGLSTFALSFAPLELYLLSRAFVVPVSVIASRHLGTKDGLRPKAILPTAMLTLGILMAAYRPNLPRPMRAEWAAAISSIAAALWPLQWRRLVQSLGERSQTEYQRIGGDISSDNNQPGSLKWVKILRFLQSLALFAVAALLPILLISGEVGYISRNCYSFTVLNFWIYQFSSGVFRAILFLSSALFIQTASAFTFIVLLVLIEVSQVIVLAYSMPLSSQWLGLALCLLARIGLCCTNPAFSTISPGFHNDSWGPERSKQHRNTFRRWLLHSTTLLVTLVILIFGCVSMVRETGPRIPKEASPISHSGKNPTPVLLRGNDTYLGQRPHPDATAKLFMLVEECRGTYEHLEHMRNVHRCLEFLSTKQDLYLDVPEDENSHSVDATETCQGPIIPYHIWWTGMPNWRIELFIKSYFYTQNLACSKLWIWVNTDHHPGAMTAWQIHHRFQRFMPFVTRGDILLKEWKLPSRVPLPHRLDVLDQARYYAHPGEPNADGDLLVADCITRDSSGQEWIHIYSANDEVQLPYYTVAVSDAARLIILHLYGGVYMDPDMLLLRDLRPLLLPKHGFAERWGTSPIPAAYNNGLLYLNANSTLSSYLLLGGTRMGLMYHFLALGRMLVQEGRDDRDIMAADTRELLKLENAFFDPVWAENDGERVGRCAVPCLSTFEQLFQAAPVLNEWQSFDGAPIGHSGVGVDVDSGKHAVNRTMENFYRGAYALHVHNMWNMKYETGSWVDVMCQAHDGFFAGERTNPYGERWDGPDIKGYLD